ncbi:hypothetical protein ACIRPH_31260 [Nocardiopsis sp. NPDC101807]|uniref:hypothetical protein n=1 Tax=Nocardiopsis sp. NPDC101807 TaxID=3364339 RepID=UPI00381D6C84
MTHSEMAALLGEAADAMDRDGAELARLKRMYGDVYRLWRTPRYWMGSALVDDVEPTLMEESAAALEKRLRSPGVRVGGPYKADAL